MTTNTDPSKETAMPKYTLIEVNGNAFAVMGYTARALKNKGLHAEVQPMLDEAKAGNYTLLVATCDRYVQMANEEAVKNGYENQDDYGL